MCRAWVLSNSPLADWWCIRLRTTAAMWFMNKNTTTTKTTIAFPIIYSKLSWLGLMLQLATTKAQFYVVFHENGQPHRNTHNYPYRWVGRQLGSQTAIQSKLWTFVWKYIPNTAAAAVEKTTNLMW